MTSPRIELGRTTVPPPAFPASDPGRMDRLNELVAEVAAERPDVVRVIDVAGHLRGLPGGELDPRLRPDGVHLTEDASEEIIGWLGPELVAAAESALGQEAAVGSAPGQSSASQGGVSPVHTMAEAVWLA